MVGRNRLRASLGIAAAAAIAVACFANVATAAAPASDPIFQLQVAALERGGLAPVQARRGIEFQRAVDEAKLAEKLESRLGQDFGGAWLQPSTAKLHVGVTSRAGQRAVQAIAEQAGFADGVIASRVRSSWEELRAAQGRWDEELSDLFARGEVATAPDPRSNAVEVWLGSDVAPARREALERLGPIGGARAEFVSKAHSRLGTSPTANNCGEFKEDEALCDPTITAGVTIKNENDTRICTAGPAVVRKKQLNTTQTFLLTAGHCTKEPIEVWRSFDKAKKAIDIGLGFVSMTRQAKKNVDVGLINVEDEKWQTAGQIPIDPAVAAWGGAPHEPLQVVSQQEPLVGRTTCFSGQSSGTKCGVTKGVGLTLGPAEATGKEQVVVEAFSKVGDSGGPFFTTGMLGAAVEGTLTGTWEEKEGEKMVVKGVAFSPLKYSFERLATEGYDLKLLTFANKKRAKCPMPGMEERCFLADSYPATITGTQLGTQTLTVNGGMIKCTSTYYSGTLEEAAGVVELAPTFSGCTMFGLLAVTPNGNGCKFRYALSAVLETDKLSGSVDVVCAGVSKIRFSVPIGACEIAIGPQTGLKAVNFVDTTSASPKQDVDLQLALTGIVYSEAKGICGTSGTNGTYTGEITLKADDAGGAATGLMVD